MSRKILIISVIASLAIGFTAGSLFSSGGIRISINPLQKIVNQDKGRPANIDFGLFWEVWNSLQEKYVDKNKLDQQKMLNGAISGMVNSVGDPYTVFFEPVISKKFEEQIAGAFGGVGIEVGKRNNILTVISPIKDTPAFKAGLKAGDKILKIDGKSTENETIEEAVNTIRGKIGTKVVLTISSDGKTTKDVPLVRESIKVPTVEWKLIEQSDNKVAYLAIYAFNENVDSEFKKASEEILQSNANKLIIDLRNNPGGLLDSAINLAGWMLDKGQLVVTEKFGNGTKNDFTASGNGALKSYPTAILMNGGSASASEILAGALHDNRKVQLIGEKSFGKGSVQELEKFANESSLKVTIAKWLTPSGISISEKGIETDVKVDFKPTEQDIKDNKYEIGTAGKDPQLDKAIEVLR